MKTEIKAAIIGGTAVVVAAFITGLFLYFQKNQSTVTEGSQSPIIIVHGDVKGDIKSINNYN